MSVSSNDDRHWYKRPKIHCNCRVDRSWWMTVSIASVNKVLRRIQAAIDEREEINAILTGVLLNPSNDPSQDSRNILEGLHNNLLYRSMDILDSLKDDMKQAGGRERHDLS